jgi:hypothetical protein
MATKKGLQYALFLLPAFYILHNYNQILGFIDFQQIVSAAILFYIPLLISYFVMIHLHIPTQKTSLILLIISFFVLFFGTLQKFFSHTPILNIVSNFFVFTAVCFLIIILFVIKVLKSKEINPNISGPINIILIVLIGIEIGAFVINKVHINKTKNLIYPEKPLSDHYVSPGYPDSCKPDIYFFVFDAYTNNPTLKTVWNFDNSQITDWLAEKGFHIGNNTHSNYDFTTYSVSSTFNMNFIPSDKGNDASITKNILRSNKSLSDNETFSILSKENYKINFIAPFRNSIQENDLGYFFDYLVAGQIQGQTFPGCLRRSNFFITIRNKLYTNSHIDSYYKVFEDKYQNILKTVDKIKKTTDSTINRRPNFVYGHILVPHAPALFDAHGKFISPAEALTATYFNTYVDQIKFANTLIMDLIHYIQIHNKKNTIILIEGDHGYSFYSLDSIPQFGFKNFNAIYFPDKNYSQLYDTLSPVNEFRIIFNKYFRQNYPLLEDSSTHVTE